LRGKKKQTEGKRKDAGKEGPIRKGTYINQEKKKKKNKGTRGRENAKNVLRSLGKCKWRS